MRAAASITTFEMAEILRVELERRLGVSVDSIEVTSYDKARIRIDFEGDQGGKAMVEAHEFRHRSQAK